MNYVFKLPKHSPYLIRSDTHYTERDYYTTVVDHEALEDWMFARAAWQISWQLGKEFKVAADNITIDRKEIQFVEKPTYNVMSIFDYLKD